MQYTIEKNFDLTNEKYIDFEIKNNNIDILNLKPNQIKNFMVLKNEEIWISKLQIINSRNRLEIDYETNEKYRNKGYMHILLNEFLNYMRTETKEKVVYALITNNPVSEKILIDLGFVYDFNDEYGKWYVYNLD